MFLSLSDYEATKNVYKQNLPDSSSVSVRPPGSDNVNVSQSDWSRSLTKFIRHEDFSRDLNVPV